MSDEPLSNTPESVGSAPVARRTYGSLAAEAAAYLGGSGNIIPRSRGDASEIRKQSRQLCKWAEETRHLIDYIPPANAPTSGGVEHEVFFHAESNRVFKKTHPGTFGSIRTERGLKRTATPYFYLIRLELTNQVFRSDLRLEGVTRGDKPSIVISQPWAHPANKNVPLPSEVEIRDFMVGLGFAPVPEAPLDWFREFDGVRVADAKPDNFMRCEEGVVPIDLIVSQ